MNHHMRGIGIACAAFVALTVTLPGFTQSRLRETLDFAAQMAQQGNWREARYRWERAERMKPGNPRVLSNLAVAAEILGEDDAARDYYRRAIAIDGRETGIGENARRFEQMARLRSAPDDQPLTLDMEIPPQSGKTKLNRNAFRVAARFQLPPRLDVSPFRSLLVASFLTDDVEPVDANAEITRFLRREFHKKASLDVLDVSPAPAIPEQRLEDLIANVEFWKHLGREYDADLIVSGAVVSERRDASGFEDVDVISRVTGQKVRESRFVEREEFKYSVDILFVDGKTGELHFRDRLQRSAVFPGTSNDALTAFYGLMEVIAVDVLAVVSPRAREDVRIVYKS